ncbi:MAG: flagellar biosynthesis protein FlhB [Rhodospirillales bacterium]|nr:flagellar biosynthesis protein FlhB [Rhodospirillales bacterium]
MAEEAEDESSKTEEPTGKRLEEAREKGQVAATRELNHWMMFMGLTLGFSFLGTYMWRGLTGAMVPFLERPHEFTFEGGGLQQVIAFALISPVKAILPLLVVLMIAAAAAQLLQNGFLVSAQPLIPKFSKISPTTGFKRMFSFNSVFEFLKGLIKITIVGTVCWYTLKGEADDLSRFIELDLPDIGRVMMTLAMKVMVSVISIMTLIAGLDYLYQRFQHYKRLRMSKQEIKDEYKQSEGDPVVKGRIKQLRMERARRRMMTAIPKATVVVTNPTHYAVALRYDESTAAPMCVAKGVDLTALKIREVATEHEVPIVENRPLARALYASVDIDEEIPPEHYKAVAEVISYVMNLKKRLSPQRGPVQGEEGPAPRPPAR